MINVIRKYQQPVLIGITVIVIATFIWFWNGPAGGRSGFATPNKRATIYGQNITDADIQQVQRKYEICKALGMTGLLEALAGDAQTEQQLVNNFIVNYFILRHEADALQVFATDSEVEDELTQVAGFQTDGHFDPVKLTDFVQNALPSMGFNDQVIDDLLRDQVRAEKVMALISSAVTITPTELHNRFEIETEKMDVSVVRLNTTDLEKVIPISDGDAKAAYSQRPDTYQSEEQRKVSVAAFELTPAQREVTGKARTDALQALGGSAWNFAQAVVDSGTDFATEAKKFGATLSTSSYFTASQPDPAYSKITSLATNAFRLSDKYPSSDVLDGQNGYYVLHLEGSVPSRQLTFEEAKAQIVTELKKERAGQMMQTEANALHDSMVAQMKAGKSFADAAKSMRAMVETVPPFSLLDASKSDVPDIKDIIKGAVTLTNGRLSDFIETSAGGLFVYMNGRKPLDEAEALMEEPILKEQFARQEQLEAYLEWLRLRKEDAHIEILQPTVG
ncbi:MAG: peptidyl-prolyl cis-trans isomerase [Chthoniobacteraceae bacterium]|jgi:parvulin-like peptidyl-prolyl isomerase